MTDVALACEDSRNLSKSYATSPKVTQPLLALLAVVSFSSNVVDAGTKKSHVVDAGTTKSHVVDAGLLTLSPTSYGWWGVGV